MGKREIADVSPAQHLLARQQPTPARLLPVLPPPSPPDRVKPYRGATAVTSAASASASQACATLLRQRQIDMSRTAQAWRRLLRLEVMGHREV